MQQPHSQADKSEIIIYPPFNVHPCCECRTNYQHKEIKCIKRINIIARKILQRSNISFLAPEKKVTFDIWRDILLLGVQICESLR